MYCKSLLKHGNFIEVCYLAKLNSHQHPVFVKVTPLMCVHEQVNYLIKNSQ